MNSHSIFMSWGISRTYNSWHISKTHRLVIYTAEFVEVERFHDFKPCTHYRLNKLHQKSAQEVYYNKLLQRVWVFFKPWSWRLPST